MALRKAVNAERTKKELEEAKREALREVEMAGERIDEEPPKEAEGVQNEDEIQIEDDDDE